MSDLCDTLAHFQRRVIQDALTEATADYWRRRADALDAARPRPGDYPGTAGRVAQRAREDRLSAAAAACRHRALIAADRPADEALIASVMGAS